MHRRLQFGMRENTASPRQHASRFAVKPVTSASENKQGSNQESKSHMRGLGGNVERPLTCEEAAELVRVHPKTVKRMARTGELPGHFRFGRWFFYASELDCWMRAELHSSRHSCRQD